MAKRYDIHLQTLPEVDQRDTFKFMSFGFQETLGVVGFQMLINQWLKHMLTPRGSDPTNLSYGTDFAKAMGSNLDVAEAQDLTLLSISNTNEYLTAVHRLDNTLTSSERLGSATLVDFLVDNTAPGFTARVEIINQARERLTLNLSNGADV